MDSSNIQSVHFIGIGGIGISAIARMMLGEGKKVSGSDRSETQITDELAKAGAEIFYMQEAKNIPQDADLVIYTIAIPEDNAEFAEAKKRGVKMMSYPQFLGELSKSKFTIAVSGTHGKTTTTAMIAEIMSDACLDPTVIVGSLLKSGSNFIFGKSNYLVVEACEYKRSFLNLHPTITVITNIDNDHLDYYKDLADIQSAFKELIEKEGNKYVVCTKENPTISPILGSGSFELRDYEGMPKVTSLKIPGDHNIRNAQAALATAKILGISEEKAVESLKRFAGTWRRFEYKGKAASGALVYDDYGHHPTEVRATLQGARALFPDKRILVIFQPHLYSRTKDHLAEFGQSFKDVDEVVIAPIYAAREPNDPSISAEMVAREIQKNGGNARACDSFETIREYAKMTSCQVIMTMGAGDIYKVGEELLIKA